MSKLLNLTVLVKYIFLSPIFFFFLFMIRIAKVWNGLEIQKGWSERSMVYRVRFFLQIQLKEGLGSIYKAKDLFTSLKQIGAYIIVQWPNSFKIFVPNIILEHFTKQYHDTMILILHCSYNLR